LGNAWLDNWFFGFGCAKEGLTWIGLDFSGLAMAQLGRAIISLAMVPIVFRVIAMTGAPLGLAWLWRRLDAIGLAWILEVQGTAQKGLTWIPVVWQWKRPA